MEVYTKLYVVFTYGASELQVHEATCEGSQTIFACKSKGNILAKMKMAG